MNWTKDRYTIYSVLTLTCLVFFIYGIDKANRFFIIGSPVFWAACTFLMATRKSRLHIEDGFTGRLMLKGENDDRFKLETSRKNLKDIDGICLEGRRYKTRDGTDVCIDKDGNLKPCGFGSYLVNAYKGIGGWEPAAIQNDDHWKGCKE